MGVVRLGLTRDEVTDLLGAPVEEIDPDEEGDVHWVYPEEDAALAWIGAPPPAEDDDDIEWVYHVNAEGETVYERDHSFQDRGICFYVNSYGVVTACGVSLRFDAQDEPCWPEPRPAQVPSTPPST